MVIHKIAKGCVILKNQNDTYAPPTSISLNWKHWTAIWDIKTCKGCKDMHGKIYAVNEKLNSAPPLHPNCRCVVKSMEAVAVGVGTRDGTAGADWWLRNYGVFPSNYISEEDLRSLGWDNGDSPAKYTQEKKATMGEYQNKNGNLPQALGRIWYEADIKLLQRQAKWAQNCVVE